MDVQAREELEARLSDLIERSEKGVTAVSRFFTPEEKKYAKKYLLARGVFDLCRFWGGYPGAERERLFLFPEYFSAMPEALPEEGSDPAVEESGEDRVTALEIRGSGFRELTHRDYLGSVLSLGIERDSFGDIAVQNEHTGVIFCTPTIAKFLTETLEFVASDKVKRKAYQVGENFTDGRHYRPIKDTVASERLDCIVAALANLSRENAQKAIEGQTVQVDFETEERCDRILSAPVTVSIRGYGRFEVRSLDGKSRKGRIFLTADQLI